MLSTEILFFFQEYDEVTVNLRSRTNKNRKLLEYNGGEKRMIFLFQIQI